MKTLLIMLLVSPSVYARTLSECLDESIETSIVLKVSAMSHSENGASCSNIDSEEYADLGQQIEGKKRFRDQAVRAYNRTKKFDLNILADIDEPSPGLADADKTCAYTNVKNNEALRKHYADKYPQLKNCPAAISEFKKSMKTQLSLYAPLYEMCNIVQKAEDEMKKALGNCPAEAPVAAAEKQPEAIQRAQFSSGSSNGSRAARGTPQ